MAANFLSGYGAPDGGPKSTMLGTPVIACETISVTRKADGAECIINASDFDEGVYEKAAEPKAESGGGENALLGSSVQPSTFTLADGRELQLGEIVEQARKNARFNVERWNAQSDEDREIRIQAVVDTLELKPAG